ncbi:MAG: hypothetical protein QM817_19165 [Archangium sp.]
MLPLGFLESPWVNGTQLGRVQWAGNELHVFDSLTSTTDLLAYDSPNAISNFYVLNGRVAAWTEEVDGGSVYRVAELRTSTLQPLTIPREFSQFKFTTTVRIGYLATNTGQALEVDLEHSMLGAAVESASVFNFRRDGVVFIDPSTRALTFRPWGGAAQVLASSKCALLSKESSLALHQCADRQLAYVNGSNQRVVIGGLEVADDYYSLDTHRSMVRFFEGDALAEPGTMWLSDLSTGSVLLEEREPHFYRYRFGAGALIHSPGDIAGRMAFFDPATGMDFAALDAGNASLFPRPDQRDGGAHAVVALPSATGVGRTYRVFDLGRRVEVNVGTPEVDAVTNMYTDRFPARVVSGGSVKFLATDGTLVAAPVISDGGEESSVTDLRLSNDRTHYLGALGIYDENLAPRVELEGWKIATRDRNAHRSWVINSRVLDDGGTEQTLVTFFEDGGLQSGIVPTDVGLYGGSDYGYFIGSDDVSGVRAWFPATDSYTSSANATDWQLLTRGFVSRDADDAGISVVLHLLGEPPTRLTSPGELPLRMITHVASGRLAVRSTSGGWHEVQLSVFDLATRARKVVFQSTTERVGVFQFSADGRQLIFSVAAWDGSSAELRVVSLE